MSLRRQLLLTISGMLTISLLPTIGLLTWSAQQALLDRTKTDGARIAQMLSLSAQFVESIPPQVERVLTDRGQHPDKNFLVPQLRQQLGLQRLIYYILDRQTVHGIWVVDAQLQPVTSGSIAGLSVTQLLSASDRQLLEQAMLQKVAQTHLDSDYLKVATPLVRNWQILGATLIYLPIASVQTTLETQLRQALILGMGMLAIGGVTAYFLADWLSQPLKRLHRATQAIAQGNLDVVVEVPQHHEVTELAQRFNQMTQQLRQAFDLLEQRVSDRTQQLQQSQDHNQAILQAIPDWLFRLRSDGLYLGDFTSRPTRLGLPAHEDSVEQPISQLFPSEVTERYLQAMHQALATKTVQRYEQVLQEPTCHEEIRVVAYGKDEALFMVRDITEQKQWELAFQAAESKYREIYNNAIEGIYQTTLTGQYIAVNPALARLYGYDSPQELIASLTDISRQLYVQPQRRQEFQQTLAQFGTVANFEAEVYIRDGRTIWIAETARLVNDAEGQPLYYEGFVSNITQRKQAELELQASNQTLAQALRDLKQTQDELIASEKMAALGQLVAGVAHEVNTPLGAIRSSVTNLTKYLAHTLVQLPQLLPMLSPEDLGQFVALVQRSLDQVPLLSAKEERQLRRALTRDLQDRGIGAAEQVAELLVIMGVHADRALFLDLLAHPHYLAILEMAYQMSGIHRSTAVINTAIDRAAKVVFALKSYAHQIPEGQPVQAKITDGIDVVLTLYHSQLKRNIDVVQQYESVPLIWCYPDKLGQVWTNLIHNAIQAMPDRGTLTIAVGTLEHHLSVSITDTGCGIPTEIQAKIFEPFFTTKPAGEGSGLGLTVVQSIVAEHHGQITVQSHPGQTTFRVLFPLTLMTRFPNGDV